MTSPVSRAEGRLCLAAACALLLLVGGLLSACADIEVGTTAEPLAPSGTSSSAEWPTTAPAPSSSTLGSPPEAPCTATCADLRSPCGRVLDPCGAQLVCDRCPEGEVCGGGGFNQCGTEACTPVTCEAAGATCGLISDGCGEIVDCGSCSSGQPCVANQCICEPTTCAAKGVTCGELSDGCGEILDCGTCEPGSTCQQGTCACAAKTCASAGAACGSISDGCGATLDCGTCNSNQTCSNNTCCSASETCGNNADDDCDGVVDEGCIFACEDSTGGTCNDDDGSGDRCDPSDNLWGCSPERFFAWCNRRNDAYPNIWDNYLHDWVDGKCDGTVSLAPDYKGGYDTFLCTDSSGRQWTCTTPLVLSFDGAQGVSYVPVAPAFVLDPREGLVSLAWPAASNPWLALDRNGNGAIDDGSELFGSATVLSTGRRASQGFEPLAELDTNGDGFVDPTDAGWSQLLVWRDDDGDGRSSPDELSSAGQEGLLSISVRPVTEPACDELARCSRERAEFRWLDSKGQLGAGMVIDVYLPSQLAR